MYCGLCHCTNTCTGCTGNTGITTFANTLHFDLKHWFLWHIWHFLLELFLGLDYTEPGWTTWSCLENLTEGKLEREEGPIQSERISGACCGVLRDVMFPRFNGGSGRPVGEHIVSIKGHQLALMLESRAAVWKRMRVYITLSHLISLRTGGKARREEGRDGMGWGWQWRPVVWHPSKYLCDLYPSCLMQCSDTGTQCSAFSCV